MVVAGAGARGVGGGGATGPCVTWRINQPPCSSRRGVYHEEKRMEHAVARQCRSWLLFKLIK